MTLPAAAGPAILLVRVSSLGDVVHNMPVVADILRHAPNAQIDWVVEEGYADLVRMNAGVRTVIPFALRRWRKSLFAAATRAEMAAFRRALREHEYDYVFDTQGLLKTGLIMGMARLKPGGKKVGLANGSEGSGYEGVSRLFHTMSVPTDPRTHAVERGRIVVAKGMGYELDSPADFALRGVPLEQGPGFLPRQQYAVFLHATARDAKRWPRKNWIEIGHELLERGILVLLPWGSPAEKEEAEAMAASMPNARLLPRLAMPDAVTLLQNATIAIGVDTGLTHIAAACDQPTIEIYGDSPRWKTEGNWSPRIVNLGDKGAPPNVLEVKAAIAQLIGERPRY
ncbi:MAG TPA: lipopolysaccharide heptosyltransferase I [Burkholderiaceae bacterium]